MVTRWVAGQAFPYLHYHHPPALLPCLVGRCHSLTTPSIHNTCPPALRSNGRRLLHTLLSICQFFFSGLPSIHLDSILLPLQGNQARPLPRAIFTIHLPLSSLTATLETCPRSVLPPTTPTPIPRVMRDALRWPRVVRVTRGRGRALLVERGTGAKPRELIPRLLFSTRRLP